eukprot:SAG31_NODE_16750_length_697_cov_1.543478_1_plen_67_part_10
MQPEQQRTGIVLRAADGSARAEVGPTALHVEDCGTRVLLGDGEGASSPSRAEAALRAEGVLLALLGT